MRQWTWPSLNQIMACGLTSSTPLSVLRTPSVQNIVGLDDGLAPDQRQAITQRNCVIYTFSGYKYTLISEWIRLFWLLRILDNLISGAVCYFCTTISVFYEIYTLRMRVVAHAAIVWVGWFFILCRRSELGLVSVPIIGAGTREIWKFWEGLGRRLGKFWCPFGREYGPFGRRHLWGDSVAWSWVPGRMVGCWLQWSACWPRGARGRRCRIMWGLCGGLSTAFFMFWRQRGPWGVRHDEHRTLGCMRILLLVLAACFEGAACVTFGRLGKNVTDIYVGGLRQDGCDAHVPSGCLDQLFFCWNGTMSRYPEQRLIASKGWVVRATKSLNELLEKPDITVVALNDAIDEFDKRLASFDDIQSELELSIETEEALLDCVNKTADFREKARVSHVNAASKLLELTQSDQDAVDKSTCVSTADVKLPKSTAFGTSLR